MEKPAMNQFFDKYMKEALQSKAEEAALPGLLLNRISTEIKQKERENLSMNKVIKLKRVKPLVIVSLVFILSAATCFAASQISSLTSWSIQEFKEFPTASQIEKAVKYTPDYVEEFSNGFRFESASVRQTEALDNNDSKVGECQGITFKYTKENAKKEQSLILSTDPESSGILGELGSGSNKEVISEGNMDLIYSKVTFKVVPEGYAPTEEEQKKMDQGSMWISYGSDEVEISDIQYVNWVKDGIVYSLMDNAFGLEKDEFIGMAKEVIGTAK